MVTLRKYRGGDLPQILEIERETFPEPWNESFFRYIAGVSGDLFMVAEEEGRIIGYIVAEVRESSDQLRGEVLWGHILNVAVRAEKRSRGIGTLLMGLIEEKLERLKASQVLLEVRVSNTRAQSLYRRRGYIVTSRVKNYYVDEDALIMVKYLIEIADII